jgi:hypothetical protein
MGNCASINDTTIHRFCRGCKTSYDKQNFHCMNCHHDSIYLNHCCICKSNWNDELAHCSDCCITYQKNNKHCCKCKREFEENEINKHCSRCCSIYPSTLSHCCKCKKSYDILKNYHCDFLHCCGIYPIDTNHCCKCKLNWKTTMTHCKECCTTYQKDKKHCCKCKNDWNNTMAHCKECCITYDINNKHCCNCKMDWNNTMTHCKECCTTYQKDKKHCCRCKKEYNENWIYKHCSQCCGTFPSNLSHCCNCTETYDFLHYHCDYCCNTYPIYTEHCCECKLQNNLCVCDNKEYMLLIRTINDYIGWKTTDFVVSCCIKNKCKAYRQFITNINIPFYDFLKVKSNYNIAYHGTPSVENAYDICCNSWNVSKRIRNMYGRGEYFTTNVLTAQQYATCNGAIVIALIISPSYNNNIKIIDQNDNTEKWYVVNNTEHHKYVLPLGILKYKKNINNNDIFCCTLQQKNFNSSHHRILQHSKTVAPVDYVIHSKPVAPVNSLNPLSPLCYYSTCNCNKHDKKIKKQNGIYSTCNCDKKVKKHTHLSQIKQIDYYFLCPDSTTINYINNMYYK